MTLHGKQLAAKEPLPPGKVADLGTTQAERGTVRIDSLVSGDSLRLSGADEAHVRRLAEVGGELPPIIVHRPTMRIIDGTHRVRAAMLNGDEEIEAEFFDGSADDAFVRAVELNIAHGLPLTMTERKLAAARIVASCPDLSDRAIARSAGLSDKTVAGIRRSAAEDPQPNVRRDRGGRVHPVDTSEGLRRAAQAIAARPDAPLREVARIAGISVSTAKDVRDQLERGQGAVVPQCQKPADAAPSSRALASPVRNASAAPGPADALQDISFILAKLKGDPSLRFSDSGREFLRLLQLQCTALGQWPQLAEKLPGHCTDIVIKFARQCAGEWDAAAKALVVFVEDGASSVGEHEAGRFLRFTSRDLSILQLVSEGCTNAQIGSRLYISKFTVAQHIAKMLKQVGASNRTDLVNRAYRAGVLQGGVDATPEYDRD